MTRKNYRGVQPLIAWLALGSIFLLPVSAFSQTQISYHSNKFKLEDDIRLGRQAAKEVEQQMPILRDREATDYVSTVGQRLAAAIPPEFQHSEFTYTFKIVNASDINAFALPGGPMYVNRGMIDAAQNEGQMAGVMAHELSHVALRHGTAQATKAQKYGLLAGILGIGGAIVGGPAGAAAQVAGQGVGVYFLKFSREYETEADILGAQIMARAGYDPHDLANMFKTIERTSGNGPGFLSDHPNPKDRYARINQEAESLRVTNPIRSSRDFDRIQARLRGQPRAQSTAEIGRSGQRYPADNNGDRYPDNNDRNDRRNPNEDRTVNNPPTGRVSAPSTRYQLYTEFGSMRVKVPDNWSELRGSDTVWFVPEGGYGQLNGQQVFTHGMSFSVAQGQNLRVVNDQMVANLLQGNRKMRQVGRSVGSNVGTRYWLKSDFTNVNEATGRTETIVMWATTLRNGDILFISKLVPDDDAGRFQTAFTNIMTSVVLN
jgi:Zn-dependent protease with chaperone function